MRTTVGLLLLVLATPALAEELPAPAAVPWQEPDPLCMHLSRRDPYSTGMWGVQVLSGFDARVGGETGQRFRSFPQVLRLGAMLTQPWQEQGCWWRGNVEGLVELSGGPFSGAGTGHLVGPAALLRYNFVQPWCLAVPYAQAGVGFQHTQGSAAEGRPPYFADEQLLSVRADVGLRAFISEQVTVDAEVGYRRLGHGDRAADAVGFTLGLTWFVGKH